MTQINDFEIEISQNSRALSEQLQKLVKNAELIRSEPFQGFNAPLPSPARLRSFR